MTNTTDQGGQPLLDELLTVAEVARLAKCSDRTVRRLITSGELKATRLGTDPRVSRAEWRRFVDRDATQEETDDQ